MGTRFCEHAVDFVGDGLEMEELRQSATQSVTVG